MKLETWLRMAGIPYEVAPLDVAQAPKGKIPYIIEDDGRRMGDSTLIIEYLKSKYGRDLDAGLTAEQRAISVAFRRMIKENLFWVMAYCRYRDENNARIYQQMLIDTMDGMPDEHRPIAADSLRQRTLEQLHAQGLGRHTQQEAYGIGMEDLAAISTYLGDKPFFMGEQPTTADAAVYAYVANLIEVPIESAVKDFGRSRNNLVRYCQRMRDRFYPELGAPPAA